MKICEEHSHKTDGIVQKGDQCWIEKKCRRPFKMIRAYFL